MRLATCTVAAVLTACPVQARKIDRKLRIRDRWPETVAAARNAELVGGWELC